MSAMVRLLAAVALLGLLVGCGERRAEDGAEDGMEPLEEGLVEVPLFEVDPLWPQPLPNDWVLGSVVGVDVDSRGHVFIMHRTISLDRVQEIGAVTDPPGALCCTPAPPVLEFDPDGALLNGWGGAVEGAPYSWLSLNHGLSFDQDENIWIGGNGRADSHILKFTKEGEFLLQLGEPGQQIDSNGSGFSRVAKVSFGRGGGEGYVSDGYGNKRVAVIDKDTGEILRYWGAYGNRPSDEDLGPYDPDAPLAQQFRNPIHCAEPTSDGLVYVCDRVNDRLQVFEADGTFVTEKRFASITLGNGSVWDIAFSPDERFLYLADGSNHWVLVLERSTLDILTQFGGGGRQPGQFSSVHSIATDSQGNIFTAETFQGKRVQKFIYKGMGRIKKGTNQGPVWPGSTGL